VGSNPIVKPIATAGLTKATWGNRAGNEPKWLVEGVIIHLAGLYLRHPRVTRRVGLAFRLASRLAATDDLTTVGSRLREAGYVG
jgi:hypothetical protein